MKKKVLVITGVVVLLIALASVWGYDKYFKPNPEMQQELNNQFGEDFFNLSDEDVVNSGQLVNKKDDQDVVNSGQSVHDKEDEDVHNRPSGDDLAKNDSETSISKPEPVKDPSTSGDQGVAVKPITQEEINNKYKPRFNHLQNVALSRLDTLYLAAIKEYESRKKAGTLNSSELAKKYIQAATMLESSLDNQFYSTLDAMKAELKANNHPTNIVDSYKSEYEKAKSDMRSLLLAKVRK